MSRKFTMLTFGLFESMSKEVAPRILQELPPYRRGKSPFKGLEEQIKYAYELYNRTRKNRLNSVVLNSGPTYSSSELTRNFGTANVKLIGKAKTTPLELQDYGSILADGNWIPYLNDAAMLGAIHGDSIIYTTEPDSDNIPLVHLWDKRMKRPTVLGRELVQLDLAGYGLEQNKYEQLVGVTFSPGKWTSSSDLTFKKLYDVLDQIKVEDDMEVFVRSLKERSERI